MSNIESNGLYATLRDVSNGSVTIDDAMSRINDMTKKEMQYDPPETPIQESEVTALIKAQEGGPTANKEEEFMSNTPKDDSTEITSQTYVDEMVTNDEVPQPEPDVQEDAPTSNGEVSVDQPTDEVEEDTNRDAKAANPEEPVPEPETDPAPEEKPAYKSKRVERTTKAK